MATPASEIDRSFDLGNLELTGSIKWIDDQAVAFCNELPLTGAGSTPEDAIRTFLECLTGYLKAAAKEGNLEDVLRKHGALRNAGDQEEAKFSLTLPYRARIDAPVPY